jgi:hypothetical protein
VYFDYNLIKMQSPSLSSVVFEQTLLDSADKSLLYGAVLADSLTNAVACRKRKLEKLPTVAATEPPFYKDFLHPDGRKNCGSSAKSRRRWPLKFNPPDRQPVDLQDLSTTLFYTPAICGWRRQDHRHERSGAGGSN